MLYVLQSSKTLTGNVTLLCPTDTILGKDGTEIVAPSQSWFLKKRPGLSHATYELVTPPSEILRKLLFVYLYLTAIHRICQTTSAEPVEF